MFFIKCDVFIYYNIDFYSIKEINLYVVGFIFLWVYKNRERIVVKLWELVMLWGSMK